MERGTAPNGINDTATFNANATNQIQFTTATTLSALTINSGNYQFDTNGNEVAFTSAGLSVGSGASIAFTVSHISGLHFNGNSTAGQANITVTGNSDVDFGDNATAGSANFTVNSHGNLQFSETGPGGAASAIITTHGTVAFDTSSSAENASIISDGSGASIMIEENASGGAAQITLKNSGSLDISMINRASTTIGSLKDDNTGQVFLGSKNLAVGGDNTSTTFGGVIQDGGTIAGTGGSLTKEGAGTLTLTGVNPPIPARRRSLAACLRLPATARSRRRAV